MEQPASTRPAPLLRRPRLILSALRGGAGKTTVSLGLAAALRARGLAVTTFKKGPDYIDAGWLAHVSGSPCRNLDPYLAPWPEVERLFLEHAGPEGVAVIEGNRGLFDGLDAQGTTSTAELAKRLKAPVVLILDVTKTTRTAAAMALGCQKFDPEVNLAGVILNQVAGARHERVVRESLAALDLPVLGALPRLSLDMPERHMGLLPTPEHPGVSKVIENLARLAAEKLDLDGLAALARSAPDLPPWPPRPCPEIPGEEKVRLGVIRDEAFQFYYPENIEALEAAGAEVVFVSALADPVLPTIDGLYIGGGFPETQGQRLAANETFRASLKAAAEKGLPVYAECGGLMYLAETLIVEGESLPMVGLLPLTVDLQKAPQGHGYTKVTVDRPNPFYPLGTVLMGHEFHYSRVVNLQGDEAELVFRMDRGQGVAGRRDGYCRYNTLATYTHVHALGTPQWAEGLVNLARSRRRPGA